MIYEEYCTIKEDNGIPASIRFHYPASFNFAYDVVDKLAFSSPDKKALVWADDKSERIFTFSDMRRKSLQYAKVFIKNGIGKGDRVLVSLKRHYEYWFTALALERIGAVMIPVTHMLTENDFLYRLRKASVKAAIVTPYGETHSCLEEAAKAYEGNIKLWTVREDIPGFMNLSKDAAKENEDFNRVETNAEEPMLLYFTSGTTGKPKGVMHSHTYALSHIITAKYWQETYDGGLHFTVAETGWAKASWGKFYGQWLTGSAVMVYDFDTFDPSQLVHIINRFGVTSFCAPPTVYRYMIRKNSEKMPTLRSATTAGEYLSPDIFTSFKQLTGLTLKEGYGQTESALIAGNFSAEKAVDGSMGTFSPLYRAMIVREDGSECDINEKGEIVIIPEEGKRPIGLFSSYLDDDKSYEDAWEGGVYHTGDAASRDENGYLWFMGRIDDIIKSCGYRVGPGEIEDIIITHPAVCECSVIGIPDTLRGQSIKAYIILSEGYSESRELEKEIREYCNSRLADYKWIRKISFVESFQKTISGKIMKTELRKAEGF